MKNHKTAFTVSKKEVIIKHGCKTVRMDIKEAVKTAKNLENAIEKANKYEPNLSDLLLEMNVVILELKFFSSKKTKSSYKINNLDEDTQALKHIIQNKEGFEKLTGIFSKILSYISDEKKIMSVVKSYQKEKAEKIKKMSRMEKETIAEVKLVNEIMKDRPNDRWQPIKISEDIEEMQDEVMMAVEDFDHYFRARKYIKNKEKQKTIERILDYL